MGYSWKFLWKVLGHVQFDWEHDFGVNFAFSTRTSCSVYNFSSPTVSIEMKTQNLKEHKFLEVSLKLLEVIGWLQFSFDKLDCYLPSYRYYIIHYLCLLSTFGDILPRSEKMNMKLPSRVQMGCLESSSSSNGRVLTNGSKFILRSKIYSCSYFQLHESLHDTCDKVTHDAFESRITPKLRWLKDWYLAIPHLISEVEFEETNGRLPCTNKLGRWMGDYLYSDFQIDFRLESWNKRDGR